MKDGLPAPLRIFQVNGMNGWTIEMDPFEGPQVFGALVKVGRLTVDEHAVPGRNGVFSFVIMEDAAAGDEVEEQV